MVDGNAGKGDRYRPVNQTAYARGYDQVFKPKSTAPTIPPELAEAIRELRVSLQVYWDFKEVKDFRSWLFGLEVDEMERIALGETYPDGYKEEE